MEIENIELFGVKDELFKRIFDFTHPVGEIYIQYPKQKNPNSLYNNHSVWEDITTQYANMFFRAYGDKAPTFVDDSNPSASIDTQAAENKSHNHGGWTSNIKNTSGADITDTVGAGGHGHTARTNNSVWSFGGTANYVNDGGQNWLRFYDTGVTVDPVGDHTHNMQHIHSITSEGGEGHPYNTSIKIWRRKE